MINFLRTKTSFVIYKFCNFANVYPWTKVFKKRYKFYTEDDNFNSRPYKDSYEYVILSSPDYYLKNSRHSS
jgi:hypothetical protein